MFHKNEKKEFLMPEIKSFEDLKRLREEAIRLKEMRESQGKTEVVVSMGTIGIAAGARETLKAILAFVEQKGLSDIIVRQTGSMGFEGSDPVVQVQLAEGEKVTYAKVNVAAVQRIMQDHVCDGNVVEDLRMITSETEKSK
jgi:NADP-reducing hydrogenase subunit HndB